MPSVRQHPECAWLCHRHAVDPACRMWRGASFSDLIRAAQDPTNLRHIVNWSRPSYDTALLRSASNYNQDRPRDEVQHKEWWERGFKLAENKERKFLYLQFLANARESFALEIVKKIQMDSDSKVRNYATLAKVQIERRIRQKENEIRKSAAPAQ